MRRAAPFSVASTIALAVFLTVPLRASAETVANMMYNECPNHVALRNAEEALSEAEAVQDESRYALSREAARQYYRCSHNANNSYLHDWAFFFYAVSLWGSLKTNGDVANSGGVAVGALEKLRNETKFSDVNEAASNEYDTVKKDYDRIRQLLDPSAP